MSEPLFSDALQAAGSISSHDGVISSQECRKLWSIMLDRPRARAFGNMCRDHDAAVTLSQVKVATTCAAEINSSAHVRRNGG
ncbi:MAG: hypothetical protein WA813_17475 [Beijerinckiaceae bacterium]